MQEPAKRFTSIMERIILPSQFQHDDEVLLCLMPKGYPGDSFPGIPASIKGVHFYPGKVKYDLEIEFMDDSVSRMYNIDSVFVLPRSHQGADVSPD